MHDLNAAAASSGWANGFDGHAFDGSAVLQVF